MTINNKNIDNLFYIFVTSHLIFWTLIPTITNHNLPLDTIEALAWGSNLDWGFNKHPPMSAFFPEIFFQIFGSQDWVYYLLSQIFVIISFYYVFKLSNEILKNKFFGLISVLLIETIYFYNFTTPEFNVNVCQLPFWSLTAYYSWKIYSGKDIKFWDCFFIGLFGALGFLSKYLFVYLLVSIAFLFIYVIIKKEKLIDENDCEKIDAAGVKSVNVYSVITCGSTRGVCAMSYGRDLARGKLVSVGEAVGMIAAQSIGEPRFTNRLGCYHSYSLSNTYKFTSC